MIYTDLIKVNGDFSSTNKAIDYAINPVWQNYTALWEFVSASQEGIGKVIYEHIANLVQNVRDIDTCGLHQLYSIAQELDVEDIFSYDLAYPSELEEIMNTLSISRSYNIISGYVLHNETLQDMYSSIGTTPSNIEYYDISGNITLSSSFATTGIGTDMWSEVNENYYTSTPTTSSRIQMSNTQNIETGTRLRFTDTLGPYYVQCTNVSTNSYIDISGYPLTANISLLEYADNKLILEDDTYLSGFIEHIIQQNLIKNSTFLGVGAYNNIQLEESAYKRSLEYQGFMDDIYYNPQSIWDSSTSAEIISYCTHILRNICIRASYQRETLKTIAQKHAMIGSTRAIEKLIGEYILRSFTKKENWRLYVEPSGALKPQELNDAYKMEESLPSISSIFNTFDVKVIEAWDNSESMNISAESPLLCGITGYTPTTSITSTIDLSGNIVTGTITGESPVYAQGLCGYVVTGGNSRFWEGEYLSDAILLSETNSAEISAFYHNIGLTGDFSQMWETQTNLWDIYATSGLDRMAVIPDLTGTPTSAYINTPVSAIPNSGWLVEPTSLSNIHKKYIGVTSGAVPPANIKNQIYPTIAPQPFIWNLVEKLYEDFPNIYQTLLFTDQTASENLSTQVDICGNLIDSWLFYNQEYIGYNTQYEQSTNLDFNDKFNPAIDRDGPFDVDALSAFIEYTLSGSTPISEYMSGFYGHIEKNFDITLSESPSICAQLSKFDNNILSLSAEHIYQYQYDQLDNHYMLYKDDDEFETHGQIWMRYRNHPLPFPLSNGNETDKNTQQLYFWGGVGEILSPSTIDPTTQYSVDLTTIYNSHCYDFGIIGDIMWIFGSSWDNRPEVNGIHDDRLIIFTNDYVYQPDIQEDHYSYIMSSYDEIQNLNKDHFIGVYSHLDYIIIVYLESMFNGTATFKFKHYDKYDKHFVSHPRETVIIPNLQPVYSNTTDHVWKLAVSEELVTIAYESVNSTTSEFVNSITTIDLLKDTLSDQTNDYATTEWKHILENM